MTSATTQTIEQLAINTIRMLSADAVQRANSGHPGAPMGAAPMAYTLWTRFLRHNPADPQWPDRDRFVLSAGHASMLLYSLLHLTGYDVSLDDIRDFRQLHSRTPGHPERGVTPGVETTTGPLGQGFANAVGMAMAERWLAERYNRPGHEIVDHYTYALASDGDLMEGVAAEATSLAGHLRLGKLIVLYDDNAVTLDALAEASFSEDVDRRFEACGWHTVCVEDGNDLDAVTRAIEAAQSERERPSLVRIKTHIGYGSPNKQDSHQAHGSPLGEDEVRLTKDALDWPQEPSFHVPDDVVAHYQRTRDRGRELQTDWQARWERYRAAYPAEAADFERAWRGELPAGWDEALPSWAPDAKGIATRTASGNVMNALAQRVPELVGGAADLASSTMVDLKGYGTFGVDPAGRNVYFGVREHAMAAAANGMAAHGGVRPFGSTFLVFSDYMRPAIRLAALMDLPVIYVFTHDSIALGEDGPTHQPDAHIPSLRAIPNLTVIRPADANETAEAWRSAMRSKGPVALVLTRQNVPVLDRSVMAPVSEAAKGGYVLSEDGGEPEVILIATGSEVHVALGAAELLRKEGRRVRVVDVPSWELFEEQTQAYRDTVLPPACRARVAVEAAVTFGWERYVGERGRAFGLQGFGDSAPGGAVMKDRGFTPERIAEVAREVMAAVGE